MKRQLSLSLFCIIAMATVGFCEDHFAGTWKMNMAKSKYSPGPAPKSVLVKSEAVEGGLKVIIDTVDAEGKSTHAEWTGKFDGKDYPVKGDPGRDAVSLKKIDDYTLEVTNKKGGKVVTTNTEVFARDGKSRTISVVGANAQGQKINNQTVWERQ
jgi:hypothetical protein